MSNVVSAVPNSPDLLSAVKRPAGERRRSPRIAVRLPGLVCWREGWTERVEKVSTISINRFGCALESQTFFLPGTRVRLEFGGKIIEGHVVHSLKDHSVNLVTIGVAFDYEARGFWPAGFELGH